MPGLDQFFKANPRSGGAAAATSPPPLAPACLDLKLPDADVRYYTGLWTPAEATEIITELEPVPRGLYTGAIGFLGFNGESQFNIAIRTLIHENGHLDYHVGAGIVADSDPAAEFEETEHKARGVRLALES